MSPRERTDDILSVVETTRMERGMSVLRLVKSSGIDCHTYYRWMRGETTPSLYNLCAVLEVLGLDISITEGGVNNA